MRKYFIVCLLGITTLYSCDSTRVYEENVDFETRIWTEGAIQEFKFQIKEAEKPYNLKLNLRNSLLYPYQNLYTTIVLEDSMGNELNRLLKNSYLFDETTGEPLGEGLGDIFDHQVEIFSNYKFPKAGQYSVFVSQSMRLDSLGEIMSVGIRVENAEAEQSSQ